MPLSISKFEKIFAFQMPKFFLPFEKIGIVNDSKLKYVLDVNLGNLNDKIGA